LLMAQELNLLTGDRHRALYGAIEAIRRRIRTALQVRPESQTWPLFVPLTAAEASDSRIAGGKAAGLSNLRRVLPDLIPPGFVITTAAYRLFIEENGLADRIRLLLADLDVLTDHPRFRERTRAIRDMILASPVPEPIGEAITKGAGEIDSTGAVRWAVRSSALSEGEGFSFAGQFDSRLDVRNENLLDAYRSVLASRFSDHAVKYRLHFGLREVDTPMAVLCMPMLEPKAAGVIDTCDPRDPDSDNMILCAVKGLADRMIRGEERGEIHVLARTQFSGSQQTERRVEAPEVLSAEQAEHIGRVALEAARALGAELDLEWALDPQDRLWLLQARRLPEVAAEDLQKSRPRQEPPILECGYTMFPGRAEGPPERLDTETGPQIKRLAPVLVLDQGTPALAPLLPRIAALLIAHGNPVGHLATLVREFRVPTIYGLGDSTRLLGPDRVLSVDATRRRIYRGSRWPGVRQRILKRITTAKRTTASGPLYEGVLALNLTDPFAGSFRAGSCNSFHDVVRFIHEMSVRSMFHFGDKHNRFWRRSVKRLESRLPIKLRLLDLNGCTPERTTDLKPENVASVPFHALWRGISDPRIHWDRIRFPAMENMPADFVEQVMGGTKGPRRRGDTNYALVASDYLNLNARFAFHYAMLDAIVGPGKEGNHVHFRFRGGGGADDRRIRRARFLESVLRALHFGVDRREDLVTAWLRHYPQAESERALEMLGRLMACSRQLDVLFTSDEAIEQYTQRFLNEDYAAFG
jgi:pyruvate,water dikinase